MSDRYSIHIPVEPQCRQWTTLLSILEGLMPVKFSFSGQGEPEIAGKILMANVGGVSRRSRTRVSSLSVPEGENATREGELIEFVVRFSDDPGVPFPFRGRSLRTKLSAQPTILSLSPDDKPLASCELGPVWAFSEGEAAKHFRSGFGLPFLSTDGSLQDVLSGRRFLEMLPLLHWLRQICASTSYDGPAMRACFIFDDPNLHWRRYGFVDYRKLAVHAEKENYHVSFATIPLDTWFTHRETAGIFRENPRLSLSVHGNNHTKRELGRDYSEAERTFLLRQAIQRIERLEGQTGLAVSRVMVPPHGACSEEMLSALPRFGFEAACISHASLRAHNKSRAWTKNLGFLPSEMIKGCPVLPRWALSGDVTNTILLAAFLKQAIVLRGHHQDLRNGIELLDDLARFINGLGTVAWSNMTNLSRSNYQWRTAGTAFQLKPLGGKVTCSLPTEVDRLSVETLCGPSSECWKVQGANGSALKAQAGEVVSLPALTNGAISFEIASDAQAAVAKVSERTPPSVLVRRFLTEGRDRFLSSR